MAKKKIKKLDIRFIEDENGHIEINLHTTGLSTMEQIGYLQSLINRLCNNSNAIEENTVIK